jgi:hypothetical protein
MIIVLQAAGVVAVLVGLVAIGVGIPVKEFSFGNTLILSGTVGLCTGLILLGLSVVARELRLVAGRLAAPRPAADPRGKAALPPFPAQPGTGEGPAFSREPSMASPNAGQTEPGVVPPFELEPVAPAASAPPQPPTKQRRNLMFSSSVRKDRERPPARPGDPTGPAPVAEPGEAPPASFEDAWPKPDRARPAEVAPQRRAGRPAPAESTGAVPPPAPAEPPPTVTVLKSGVVDGMAYSLYSDGSIEAQMPEGMMRFASIDELRAHLDQRL